MLVSALWGRYALYEGNMHFWLRGKHPAAAECSAEIIITLDLESGTPFCVWIRFEFCQFLPKSEFFSYFVTLVNVQIFDF